MARAWGKCHLLVCPLWNTVGKYIKPKSIYPFDPAIPHQGSFLTGIFAKKTRKSMVALSAVAKDWEQPKCPLQELGELRYLRLGNIARPDGVHL